MSERPNPDRLLRYANEEERQAHQGKLKIYLGAAPGVGKTYSMLQDALSKRTAEDDVVIGIVESHGRKEIDALIEKFEVLPRQIVPYHDKQLQDFDLDAALKRNPSLILMDEMAHSNPPGLRHAKRWQDIKELLDRGIDVFTTLNVQHIESLNDIVSQIIHTQVKETVPDSMLDMAHTIELIDLPPEDLIKRLQEGKVYFPQQIEMAKNSFFREGNLYALRELALRTTAQRVGAQMLLYRHGKGIKHIWPSNEKIIVCVGPGPESVKLIRTAKRMARDRQADWIAVYVSVPQIHADMEGNNNPIAYLRLAEQLGGQTQILSGNNIVEELMQYAREQNVSQIIVGKKIIPRWRVWFTKSLSDEIIRSSQEIDVLVVTRKREEEFRAPKAHDVVPTTHIPWLAYLFSFGMVAVATIINFMLITALPKGNLIIIYLLAITLVALLGELGPALLAIVLSMVSYHYVFCVPPKGGLHNDLQNFISLIMILIVGAIISQLTILNRRQTLNAKMLQRQTSTLHELSRQLASTRGVDKLLAVGLQYISEHFTTDVMAILPKKGTLEIRARYKTTKTLDDKEMGVAHWVYELGQVAGLGTDTLPFADAVYMPLLAAEGTIGVLRIHPISGDHLFTPQQMHMLEACANQIAVAIEVDRLAEQTREQESQQQNAKVRNLLLETISHDLRTPLRGLLGSSRTLLEMSAKMDRKMINQLANSIYADSEELNRLIINLLKISSYEKGNILIQKKKSALSDVIDAARTKLGERLNNYKIVINIPDDFPDLPFDYELIQEVFVNLLDNAIKFTPKYSQIIISAKMEPDQAIVSIEDEGPGIVLDEVNKLFEKFYRGRMLTTESGLGLGLAICREIIRAHGGKIWAENGPEIGAAFRFTLPLK